MKAQEFSINPQRSGVIPYYWKDSQLWVKVMRPSDPAYGGTEWQIAKGGLEDGLSHAENAVKEAIEDNRQLLLDSKQELTNKKI